MGVWEITGPDVAVEKSYPASARRVKGLVGSLRAGVVVGLKISTATGVRGQGRVGWMGEGRKIKENLFPSFLLRVVEGEGVERAE